VTNSNNFHNWLISQSDRNDPVGDLALDVKRDDCAPKGDASHDEWMAHLIHMHASRECILSFDQAWSEFSTF
jgi:uncharacterized protein YozE (UPF0346 family)